MQLRKICFLFVEGFLRVIHLSCILLLQDGETPLLRATQKKHTAIVSLLLEKGASVSVADKVSYLNHFLK